MIDLAKREAISKKIPLDIRRHGWKNPERFLFPLGFPISNIMLIFK